MWEEKDPPSSEIMKPLACRWTIPRQRTIFNGTGCGMRVMAWQGELFKAVSFPSSGDYDAADLWAKITKTQAPNVQRSQLPPPVRSVAAGAWGASTFLQVIVQVGRIEAVVTAIDPTPNEPTPIPPLPPAAIDDAISKAREAAQLLARDVTMQRVAAHLQFVDDTASGEAATAQLNSIVGGVFGSDTTDQLFQFNARKQSKSVPSMQVNRLVKWGSVSLKQVTVAVTGGSLTSQGSDQTRDVLFMHFDLNNVPLASPMTKEQSGKLTEELWDEAIRIYRDGPSALN